MTVNKPLPPIPNQGPQAPISNRSAKPQPHPPSKTPADSTEKSNHIAEDLLGTEEHLQQETTQPIFVSKDAISPSGGNLKQVLANIANSIVQRLTSLKTKVKNRFTKQPETEESLQQKLSELRRPQITALQTQEATLLQQLQEIDAIEEKLRRAGGGKIIESKARTLYQQIELIPFRKIKYLF